MNIRNILILFSSVVTIAGIIPYIVDIIKRKTKPRVVSWLIWSILTFISFIASIVEQQYPTAILMFCSFFITMMVFVLGIKYGNKNFGKLDVICLIGATLGILLWVIFDSPSIAVIIMIVIDFIGGIPTQIHCWQKPEEETLIMFIFSAIGALFTLIAVQNWIVTAYAFPLFLLVINIHYILIITIRKKVLSKKKR